MGEADNFCPNCRFVMDDNIETIEKAAEAGTSCTHRDMTTNEYFGADDGEHFKFHIITDDEGFGRVKLDGGRTGMYLDDMMEDVNAALIREGVDPETGRWIDRLDPVSEMLRKAREEDEMPQGEIWTEDDYIRAFDRLADVDDEDEVAEVSRGSRRRQRNKNSKNPKFGGIIGALESAVHTVRRKDKFADGGRTYTPEERAEILAKERSGVAAS